MGKFFRLYGRNSVSERLKVNPETIHHVLIDKSQDVKGLEQLCKLKRIPIRYLSERDFEKISRNIRAQGIIADVEKFYYTTLDAILSLPQEKLTTLLFLDSLNDPQNFGSILRSAACFGGFAIVLPKHDSVEITEAVLRVASGGENYVSITQVTNLSSAINEAKQCGYSIAGAMVGGGQALPKVHFTFPLGLVIGSEAKGIRHGLLKQLDVTFTIPIQRAGLSFNAAIASGIVCYEVCRQRK